MASKRIEEIKARLAAITPGEWFRREEDGSFRVAEDEISSKGVVNASRYPGQEGMVFCSTADAEFILSAAKDIEYLLQRMGDAPVRP